MNNDLKPGYKIGLPAPDDTPADIARRDRMWKGIRQKIRASETWGQWVKRIVRGWSR